MQIRKILLFISFFLGFAALYANASPVDSLLERIDKGASR